MRCFNLMFMTCLSKFRSHLLPLNYKTLEQRKLFGSRSCPCVFYHHICYVFLMFFHKLTLFLYFQDKVCQKVGVLFFFHEIVPDGVFHPPVCWCFCDLHSQSESVKCQSNYENPLLKIQQRVPSVLTYESGLPNTLSRPWGPALCLPLLQYPHLLVSACCPILVRTHSHGPLTFPVLSSYLRNTAV